VVGSALAGAVLAAVSAGAGWTAAPLTGTDRDAAYASALGFAAGEHDADFRATICVSVGDKDPSPAFLDRVRLSVTGIVREGSRCKQPKGPSPAVLSLNVVAIDTVSEDEAWVQVRYIRTSMKRGIRTYRIVREHGLWAALGQIIKDGPL
jgi:hypothetical protein